MQIIYSLQGEVRRARTHTPHSQTQRNANVNGTTINHVIVFVYVVDSRPSTRFYTDISIEADGAGIDSTTTKSAFSSHHRWGLRGRFAYVKNGSNNV